MVTFEVKNFSAIFCVVLFVVFFFRTKIKPKYLRIRDSNYSLCV